MRRAGLATLIAIVTQLSCGPVRAEIVCVPGDFSASGADSYPGSARHYQGSAPGIQEKAGDRTAVPSGGRALPVNPNCFLTPHAVAENGAPCRRDSDCADKRCRLFPDGNKYCAAEQKACTDPGGDGVPGGAVVALHQQCYECTAGIGWRLCGELGKQALQNNQEGVVRQGADEAGRDDWRYRSPPADTSAATTRATDKTH